MSTSQLIIEYVGKPLQPGMSPKIIGGYLNSEDVQALCSQFGVPVPAFTTHPEAVETTIGAQEGQTGSADLDCAFLSSKADAMQLAAALNSAGVVPPTVLSTGLNVELVYSVRPATLLADGTIEVV